MKVSVDQLRYLTGIFLLTSFSLPALAGFFGPFGEVPEPSIVSLLGLGLAMGLLVHHLNKRKGK